MGRNTMRSSVNNAMRQRLFTEYLNEQKKKHNGDNRFRLCKRMGQQRQRTV